MDNKPNWLRENKYNDFNKLPQNIKTYIMTKYFKELPEIEFREWYEEIKNMYNDRYGTVKNPDEYDGFD